MPRSTDPGEFRGEAPATLQTPGTIERLRQVALEGGAALACEGATQIVPGEGNPQAEIVLVGEAPGEEEDRQGRPFVGRSGKLLDRVLNTAGLDRRDVWVTNTVKCRPVSFESGRARNRAPRVGEIKDWTPILAAEIALIRPKLLVGLGAVAGKALLGSGFRITQQRGAFFEESAIGLPVIVTWHPAYLLRQQGESYQERLKEAIADFNLARDRLR